MNLKKLDLSEIKAISLKVLFDVDQFCRSHGIRYSLAFGSLLGAVRHKGIIPWDDDIDIMMPRVDYERFCREYYSPHFGLACSNKYKDCYINYARVYDQEMTQSQSLWPWIDDEKSIGVWIDVFPIDDVSDDYSEYCKEYAKIQKYYQLQGTARGAMARLSREYSLVSNLKTFVKKVLFLGGLISPRIWTDKMDKVAKSKDYSGSSHCAQLMSALCPANEYYYEKAWFEEYVDLEFEGHYFKAIKGFRHFLETAYGDYMQLPPEEKRGRKHPSVRFYYRA